MIDLKLLEEKRAVLIDGLEQFEKRYAGLKQAESQLLAQVADMRGKLAQLNELIEIIKKDVDNNTTKQGE